MSQLVRFGVSMEQELVTLLDELTIRHAHPNRSETIRALVRQQELLESPQQKDREVTAIISLIYHHKTELIRVALNEYPSLHLSVNIKMHLHDDIIIKILVITGKSEDVSAWARQVTGQKHVIGRITIAATDQLYGKLQT
jgi:CopG family nickel-responsive transcriptional regulator